MNQDFEPCVILQAVPEGHEKRTSEQMLAFAAGEQPSVGGGAGQNYVGYCGSHIAVLVPGKLVG